MAALTLELVLDALLDCGEGDEDRAPCPTWCALGREKGSGNHVGPCDPRPSTAIERERSELSRVLSGDALEDALERRYRLALAKLPRS